MNLAIVGYGKMGRLVEQLAPGYGFAVPLHLDIEDNSNGNGITRDRFRGIDVAVEFSTPAAAMVNIEQLAAIGVNTVVGTTGWSEHAARARAAVEKSRHRPGVEPEFFHRRECFHASGRGSLAAFCSL